MTCSYRLVSLKGSLPLCCYLTKAGKWALCEVTTVTVLPPNAHRPPPPFGNVFHSLSQVLDILPSDRGIHSYSHLSSPNCISASLGGNPCLTSPAFTLQAGVLVLAASCTVSPQNWHGSILSPITLRPDIPKKELDPWFQASPSLQPYIQREEGTLPPAPARTLAGLTCVVCPSLVQSCGSIDVLFKGYFSNYDIKLEEDQSPWRTEVILWMDRTINNHYRLTEEKLE